MECDKAFSDFAKDMRVETGGTPMTSARIHEEKMGAHVFQVAFVVAIIIFDLDGFKLEPT